MVVLYGFEVDFSLNLTRSGGHGAFLKNSLWCWCFYDDFMFKIPISSICVNGLYLWDANMAKNCDFRQNWSFPSCFQHPKSIMSDAAHKCHRQQCICRIGGSRDLLLRALQQELINYQRYYRDSVNLQG